MASMLLMHAGVARRRPRRPTSRPSAAAAAPLKVLWWQGATLLQPHFANGTKDQEGSRIFYEPLAVLGQRRQPGARSSPPRSRRVENGGLLPGGKVGALAPEEGRHLARRQALHRRRLRLHLGVRARPGDRRASPSASTRTSRSPRSTRTPSASPSSKPTPFWATAFVAAEGMIIPKHLFGPYAGAKSREAPDQPEAGRHRARTSSSTSSRATSCAARSTRTTTCRTGRISTRSR